LAQNAVKFRHALFPTYHVSYVVTTYENTLTTEFARLLFSLDDMASTTTAYLIFQEPLSNTYLEVTAARVVQYVLLAEENFMRELQQQQQQHHHVSMMTSYFLDVLPGHPRK